MPGFTSAPDDAPVSGERELILIVSREADLTFREGRLISASVITEPLFEVLAATGAELRPLFAIDEEEEPDLSLYYRVFSPDALLDDLAAKLRTLPGILAAYVKPPALPACEILGEQLRRPRQEKNGRPPATPDFTARQGYLGEAPAGIEAPFAWTKPGGSGAGVEIIDIEGAWRFSHEDLRENKGGVVGGEQSENLLWRNHGTAVIGVCGGDRNSFGVTGICPDARISAVSIFGGTGSAGAIVKAAQLLSPGDIILIELHRPGPRSRLIGQEGFIAIEWWPDDFDAIQFATRRGVLVVEAAGNGSEDLDDPVYDTPAPGFPDSWKNPFRRGERDSGAILVGAGAPPPGMHGRSHGPDRSRLPFSNYGSALDAQGWGREVTTCGYGDLQGGADEDLWYTDLFSGTSSASPIVVGALGCLQGILRARGQAPLTPKAAREILRATGSPQEDAPGRPASQRIGNRPNLREALTRLLGAEETGADPLRVKLERDLLDSAWRVAGRQLLKFVREPLAAALVERAGVVDPRLRERLADFLETELGEALFAGFLSLALSALPRSGDIPKRLARELRVMAMAGAAEALAEVLVEPLRQATGG